MLESGRDAWFDTSKVLESAQFTLEELPKRLARRLLDLQLLPYIVVTNPHIAQVYHAYRHAFDTLRQHTPPRTMAENQQFTSLLRRLVDEHAPMLDALATGMREIKRKPLVGPHLQLDTFLEAMLRSRISRRVLAEQHININNGRPGYIGIICTNLSLSDSIDFAAGRCRQVCIETFGAAPDVIVSGDTSLRVPYIPAHIDYTLYELLKNASRAVMERYHNHRKHTVSLSSTSSLSLPFAPSPSIPPIHVRICGGEDDVTLRISDQGGGIPVHLLHKAWQFGWTDVDPVDSTDGVLGTMHMREGLGVDNAVVGPAPTPPPPHTALGNIGEVGGGGGGNGGRFRMAGLGFGLPLSRLYARYFGGDLRLLSMPGYGVDAFLYLKGLVAEGRDWREDNGEEEEGESDGGVGAVGQSIAQQDGEELGSLSVGPPPSAQRV